MILAPVKLAIENKVFCFPLHLSMHLLLKVMSYYDKTCSLNNSILIRIFRVALLFICQGASFCAVLFSLATAFIEYHILYFFVKQFF